MFGGSGLFRNGVMFGLISSDALYFRTGDNSRVDFENRNMPRLPIFIEMPSDLLKCRIPRCRLTSLKTVSYSLNGPGRRCVLRKLP